MCNQNSVEDEFHFIMECQLYYNFRSTLFENACLYNENFQNLPPKDQFIFLMKECNFNVAKYIRLAWEKKKRKVV